MMSPRRLLKHVLAGVTYHSGLLNLFTFGKRMQRQREGPIILMYHRVLTQEEMHSQFTQWAIVVTTDSFERQMELLARRYHPMSLKTAVGLLQEGSPVPPYSVVVTFDDGWRDNYVNARPILEKYEVPATIFLPTDFIGTGEYFWFLKLGYLLGHHNFSAEQLDGIIANATETENSTEIAIDSNNANEFIESVKRFGEPTINRIIAGLEATAGVTFPYASSETMMLDWDEVRKMNSGLFDFGSHGQGHQILTLMDENEVLAEMVSSKAIIEKELGESVTLFSYPNGDYNDRVISMAMQAGYEAAVSTRTDLRTPETHRMYTLRRLGVHEGTALGVTDRYSPAIFACFIEQMF
jgi:peptidoglycan/xylan/chitin deacetylase (PgdA/CDA1 family)